MKPGIILLINGTSSSGKTCLVRAVQDLLPEPFLEAGIDKFIWMLPKRYLDRPLWDEVLGRAVEAGQAGHDLVSGMHQAIAALSWAGLNVVADHVLVEPAWARQCADLFADLPAYLVGIRCPLEVLEAREQSRRDRTFGQARAQFELIHRHVRYDLELDTSRLDPDECARRVQARLQTPPVALRAMQTAARHDAPGPRL